MTAQTIQAEAIPAQAPSPHSMGLSGWAAVVANLSAVGLVCLMFWQSQTEQQRLAREDRAMFREVLTKLEDRADKDRDAHRELAKAVRQLADEIRQGRQ